MATVTHADILAAVHDHGTTIVWPAHARPPVGSFSVWSVYGLPYGWQAICEMHAVADGLELTIRLLGRVVWHQALRYVDDPSGRWPDG